MTSQQIQKIEKLANLKNEGHISEDEFEIEKKKILENSNSFAFLSGQNIFIATLALIFGTLFYLYFENNLQKIILPPIEQEIQNVCLCYDEAKSSPSKEPECARLKHSLEIRVKSDSSERILYKKQIENCPNFPDCDKLQQDLNDFIIKEKSSIRDYNRALEWQFLRTESEKDADIERTTRNYNEVMKEKEGIKRRIKINCRLNSK